MKRDNKRTQRMITETNTRYNSHAVPKENIATCKSLSYHNDTAKNAYGSFPGGRGRVGVALRCLSRTFNTIFSVLFF